MLLRDGRVGLRKLLLGSLEVQRRMQYLLFTREQQQFAEHDQNYNRSIGEVFGNARGVWDVSLSGEYFR